MNRPIYETLSINVDEALAKELDRLGLAAFLTRDQMASAMVVLFHHTLVLEAAKKAAAVPQPVATDHDAWMDDLHEAIKWVDGELSEVQDDTMEAVEVPVRVLRTLLKNL